MNQSQIISPEQVAATAKRYAETAAKGTNVLIHPWLGRDSVQPFLDAGLTVEIAGCLCFILQETVLESHPAFCEDIRETIRRWGFNIPILNCEETEQRMQNAHSIQEA